VAHRRLHCRDAVPGGDGLVEFHGRRTQFAGARELCASAVELNEAITSRYGVPAVKAAMRHRDVPAGQVRSPLQSLDDGTAAEVRGLVDDVLSA